MAYDTSTANPVNPQGTVGGGNVFNAAPLFGNSSISGSGSSGSDGASTTSEDTAALGGGASGSIAADATGDLSSLWAAYGVYILIGGLVLVLGFFAVKFFRRKKK